MQSREVFVYGGARIPFAKSQTIYTGVSPYKLALGALDPLVEKFGLNGEIVGDVALGGVMMHPKDWNLSREVVLGSKLHPFTPGYNVQRACGTSLETAWHIALKIRAGQMNSGIAGGVDTNSDLPITFKQSFSHKIVKLSQARTMGQKLGGLFRFSPRDLAPVLPGVAEPRTGLSMGQHTEKMVKEWSISREDQDQLAYESHAKAAKALEEGFFNDLIYEFMGSQKDQILRPSTTMEKLSKLRTAFDKSEKGTLTAGNSTALTDGAACVLLGSQEFGQQKSLKPLAKMVDFQAAALDHTSGDGLLMAPTLAVAQLLQRNNLKLQDFDFYEIHEAFAGQVLCTLKAWNDEDYSKKYLGQSALGEIDREKLNVKGSSLAVGHPFAATGARITATLGKLLSQKSGSRGLISICTAGGMGVAAIMESVN